MLIAPSRDFVLPIDDTPEVQRLVSAGPDEQGFDVREKYDGHHGPMFPPTFVSWRALHHGSVVASILQPSMFHWQMSWATDVSVFKFRRRLKELGVQPASRSTLDTLPSEKYPNGLWGKSELRNVRFPASEDVDFLTVETSEHIHATWSSLPLRGSNTTASIVVRGWEVEGNHHTFTTVFGSLDGWLAKTLPKENRLVIPQLKNFAGVVNLDKRNLEDYEPEKESVTVVGSDVAWGPPAPPTSRRRKMAKVLRLGLEPNFGP